MKDENSDIIVTDLSDYSLAGPPDHSWAGKTKKQLIDESVKNCRISRDNEDQLQGKAKMYIRRGTKFYVKFKE